MTDKAEQRDLSAPAYRLANFAARISEAQGGTLQALVQSALDSGEAIDDLNAVKSALGIAPGKEVFAQRVVLPVEFFGLLSDDVKLKALWDGVDGTADTYSGIDVAREGFELLRDMEHYIIWVLLGLSFINFRVSFEKQTSPTTKTEISIGTNGISFAFKKQIGDFLKKRENEIKASLIGKSSDPDIESKDIELDSTELIVSAIRDTRLPKTETGLVADLLQGELIHIGSLFSIKQDSEFRRIQSLAKIASLYWEVNSPPSPGDGIPFTYQSVYGIKDGRLSASDKKLIEEWPRGFKIDVGEEFLENGETWPFVSVLSPKTIQGARATKYNNFVPSKAGRIADFIKSYLGFEAVKVYFSQNAKALHLQTGVSCRVERDGADVRGLVLDRGDGRWAIIPGHAVLRASSRGKVLKDVLAASKGQRLLVDYKDSTGSGLRLVGQVDQAHLTESYEYGQPRRRAIDAAFCKLDRLASSVGFGQYVTLAPAITGALVSDWFDFRGRYIVTLDDENRVRWARVSAHLASKHLESPATGHRFIVKNALQVQTVGNLAFAEPGMSGSLAFLTPEGSQPGRPIESEISLIGYIIGRSRYHSVDTGDDYLKVNSGSASVPEDFTIQLLQDVSDEFQSFLKTQQINSLESGV